MLRTALIAATLLAACATDDPSATDPSGGGKADGQTATISFRADYTQTVTGTLVAGSPVDIHYDVARVTDCRSSSGGSEQWGVGGWAQFDSAAPVSFEASRLTGGKVVSVTSELQIPPTASHVAIWFEINDRYGCHTYDSNFGANYGFDIKHDDESGAVLSFDADGSLAQSAAIHGGDRVTVHYAPERLSQCAASQGGYPQWGVSGHWQVDGGTVHDVSVTRADGPDLVAADPTITVPHGHDLALWFEATSVYGCHVYDSANGANYHVTIE